MSWIFAFGCGASIGREKENESLLRRFFRYKPSTGNVHISVLNDDLGTDRPKLYPMKVLFDHCVRQDAIRGEYGLGIFPREIQENYRARPPRNDWKQMEIECLDTVAGLCRKKLIIPYTTDELYGEYLRVARYPSPNYKDLFKDINFEKAQCPIKRSKWGISMKQYMDKQEVITFCRVFLRLSTAGIEKYISDMRKNPSKRLTAFEEKCLRNLNIFKKICHGIPETHYPDALHLWTAEENGLDVFLTTEKRFRNVMDRQKVKLNCRIMFPSELIETVS